MRLIPNSLNLAGTVLRHALRFPTSELSDTEFVRVWFAIAYLFPNLHPDGFDRQSSGWPTSLRRFAEEAWKRADAGALSDEELYPADAAWAGIFDRMRIHLPLEIERRLQIARIFGYTENA